MEKIMPHFMGIGSLALIAGLLYLGHVVLLLLIGAPCAYHAWCYLGWLGWR
jgi:hypothetical protein